MISLESRLAEAVSKMKRATLKKWREETYHDENGGRLTLEAQINVAESLLREDGEVAVREPAMRGSIRRHNGGGAYVSESSRDPYAEGDRILMEGIKARRPQAFQEAKEGGPEGPALSESQRREYEFCKLLGMSEADAVKVAKSTALQD
jgi:hypothetical protein